MIGWVDMLSDDDWGDEEERGAISSKEDDGMDDGMGERNGRVGEGAIFFAGYVLFVAADSRWHDTIDVPITATDLSALLMMRCSSSSLLPG